VRVVWRQLRVYGPEMGRQPRSAGIVVCYGSINQMLFIALNAYECGRGSHLNPATRAARKRVRAECKREILVARPPVRPLGERASSAVKSLASPPPAASVREAAPMCALCAAVRVAHVVVSTNP